MWIRREEYKRLRRIESETQTLRSLTGGWCYHKNIIAHYHNYVIMSSDAYQGLLGMSDEQQKERNEINDKIKNLEAELAWYKVKYHEAKMGVKSAKNK